MVAGTEDIVIQSLPCISIKPPWTKCIERELKLIENRGREVTYRGPLGIQATKTWSSIGCLDDRVREALADLLYPIWPDKPDSPMVFHDEDFTPGCVVAVAELVDCHRAVTRYESRPPYRWAGYCCQPWGDEMYGDKAAWHLVLANVRRLAEPVPAKGALRIPWMAPEDVASAVWAQLGVAA